MKVDKMLKSIAALGILYIFSSISFEAGKGWVLGSIKASTKFASAEEIINIYKELPDSRCSKTMTYVSKVGEKQITKKIES